MDIQGAFKPDKATFFRPFSEEFLLVEQLAERCLGVQGKRFNNRERLFLAWCDLRSNDDAGARLRVLGADVFARMFERAIRDAQEAIERVIVKYLDKYSTTIDPIDEIASCDDPWDLIEIIAEDRTERIRLESLDVKTEFPFAFARERRADLEKIEAMRKLAIGSQILALEAVDPMADVSRDLTIVNKLVKERLFTKHGAIRVRVNFILNKQDHYLPHPDFSVTLDDHDYGKLPEEAIAGSLPYVCRVAPDPENKRTFIVQSKSRPKEAYATIIKNQRRSVMDRRGLRHLVVAVIEDDVWRVATREDVELYAEFARRKLWVNELQEEPDTSLPNPDSSQRYWSRKIMGRLVRKSRRGAEALVAPAVEHQMIPLDVDIMNRFGRDGTDHESYRKRVVEKYVLKEWFAWHPKNGDDQAISEEGGATTDDL